MANGLGRDVVERALEGAWGHPLNAFELVGSTNTFALQWADEGAPEGALVVTDHQTGGRGRRGRAWVSEPGAALQFSLVLRPKVAVQRVPLVTTIAGVACAEGIESACGVPTCIKWPNDITAHGRKLAGILVEGRFPAASAPTVVVGIGINTGWAKGVPQEIAERATSIAAEMDAPAPPRAALLARVVKRLEERYRALDDDAALRDLLESASERSEVLGREVEVHFVDGTSLSGRADRLLESGALVIASGDSERAVESGELQHLRAR